MLYEYLIDLRSRCEGFTYDCTIIEWGEDEYDALNTAIDDYLQQEKKSAKLYNLKEGIYDFSICRVRATGRFVRTNKENRSYFNVDVRPYIKGLMTRYMARFHVSDTIEELEKYKKEFDDFLSNYGDEFPLLILEKMLNQYNSRKEGIEKGYYKPLEVNYDLNTLNMLPELAFKSFLEQAIKILRLFGLRVREISEDYEVYYPMNYFKFNNQGLISEIFSPAELINFWYYKRNDIHEEDLIKYGINHTFNPLSLLGDGYPEGGDEIDDYIRSLKKKGLTPFYFIEPFTLSYQIYILDNEYSKAIKAMREIKAEFYDPDEIDFEPEIRQFSSLDNSFH